MGFALLIQEADYMEWIENIHSLTLTFIRNQSIPMITLQNFLEFWSSFSYYADRGDKPEYAKLKKMLLEVAVNYLNAQCDIINGSGQHYLEEIFENDSSLHEYMRHLALLSQPKYFFLIILIIITILTKLIKFKK